MVVGTNLANVTSWTDTHAACDTTWYYQVRAFKGKLLSSSAPYASANTASFDSDGDGVGDCWMLKYFGHVSGEAADNSRASDDRDGDGMSNLQEFLAGTNPTNSMSALRITGVVVSGNGVKLTWRAVGGKQYVVQTNATPGTGFNDLSPVITMPGNVEASTNYLDAGAVSNTVPRFYRIRVVR